MTVREAIERADARTPNAAAWTEKLMWLSELEGKIAAEILDTHEGGGGVFEPLTELTDKTMELLVPHPWDALYVSWLEAQIHLINREIDSYNNAMLIFQGQYNDYARYYNRTRRPKTERFHYFGG